MFKRFAVPTVAGLTLIPGLAMAQIDVTPITDALGDAATAVGLVMAAAAVVWGLMVGIRYLKRVASGA